MKQTEKALDRSKSARILQKTVVALTITSVLWSGPLALAAEATAGGDESTQGSTAAKDTKGGKKQSSTSDIDEIIKGLDYPELQVVPRASERLKLEAKEEESTWFLLHWPVMFTGLSTLGVGAITPTQPRDGMSAKEKTDMTLLSQVTMAAGAGWFLTGLALGFQRPYSSGLARISKFPGKDERSVLLRERLAEESIERPANFMRPIVTASVLTDLALNIACGAYMNDQGKIAAGVSAIVSLFPVIFEDPVIMIHDKHLEYKKKIYGPLTSGGLGYDRSSNSFYPTANFAWLF